MATANGSCSRIAVMPGMDKAAMTKPAPNRTGNHLGIVLLRHSATPMRAMATRSPQRYTARRNLQAADVAPASCTLAAAAGGAGEAAAEARLNPTIMFASAPLKA